MATSPISSSQSQASSGNNQALRGLDMDDFLRLMITELQNQDPLNPLENNEILQQISQIREIGATGQLSDTLDAVLRGQNLSSASSLIGKQVQALADNGGSVTGPVDRVSLQAGAVRLHVGEQSFSLENVSEILPS